MNQYRIGVVCFILILFGGGSVSGQSGETDGWTVPRTTHGHPDLQGIWANDSATPLERPDGFEGKSELTEEEFSVFQERAAELNDASRDAGFVDEVFLAATRGADEVTVR